MDILKKKYEHIKYLRKIIREIDDEIDDEINKIFEKIIGDIDFKMLKISFRKWVDSKKNGEQIKLSNFLEEYNNCEWNIYKRIGDKIEKIFVESYLIYGGN